MDLADIAEGIAEYASHHKNAIINRLISETTVLQKSVSKRLTSILDMLIEESEKVKNYIKDLLVPQHATRKGEGKGLIKLSREKVQMITAWLALSPFGGKFLVGKEDFKADSSKPYKICTFCSGMATLGLYSMSICCRRETSSLELVPLFDGTVNGRVIYEYNRGISEEYDRLATKIGRMLNVLPERTISKVMMILIASLRPEVIEDMYLSEAIWHIASLKLEKGARMIRGYEIVNIDRLLTTLYRLIQKPREVVEKLAIKVEEGKETPGLIDTMIRRIFDKNVRKRKQDAKGRELKVDVEALVYLADALTARDLRLLYHALREINKDEACVEKLSLDLVEALIEAIVEGGYG